jgi:predicted cupin superfamily sugar epimerase
MHRVKQLIDKYKMQQHPEGGYYYQTYINDERIDAKPLATSIYFLLGEDDVSRYHRLQSDEVWYYHEGGSLLISMITPEGEYKEVLLGSGEDAVHQYTVPRGTIFGSVVKDGRYILVGCMVSHGFSFDEFELFDYKVLQRTYPEISKNLFHI